MPSGSLSPPSVTHSSSPSGSPEPQLDLRWLPIIYVLTAHLPSEELHHVEETLLHCGAPLTYDATEAKVFLGKLNTKKRAQFELRSLHIRTEEVTRPSETSTSSAVAPGEGPPRKRSRKEVPVARSARSTQVSGSTTESATEGESPRKSTLAVKASISPSQWKGKLLDSGSSTEPDEIAGIEVPKRDDVDKMQEEIRELNLSDNIMVLKVHWLEDSLADGRPLPVKDYLIYEGRPTKGSPRTATADLSSPVMLKSISPDLNSPPRDLAEGILERARADTPPRTRGSVSRFASAPHGSRRFATQGHGSRWGKENEIKKRPLLQLETTSQDSGGADHDMPEPPSWVRQKLRFACQRSTPAPSPNEHFIDLLKNIRLARILTGDEIGVRAYSTSIAAIAAYPSKFISPREILRLPGCDVKIANLWIELKNTGGIQAAEEVDTDPTLKILKTFYDIWGVGATTAREFFDRGWTELDDIVEFGWDSLSRVQQIGVKYYDEFQRGIPRDEVEFILDKVREHAVKVRDDDIEALVVGGYRRGKAESGDVDIIVSHRDLDKTANLVEDIVNSLEEEGWITHTLLLALTGTRRGQSTLPFKSAGVASHGVGFDTLDKALVVWQDINWAARDDEDSGAKNPNIHRRVDIIISPWRTVGCAVLGWSGGTTFQRDLRRYAKAMHGWKFDSSGIRDRRSGEVIVLEGAKGISGDMVDAEKVVFQGLGLEYREPWERCTG